VAAVSATQNMKVAKPDWIELHDAANNQGSDVAVANPNVTGTDVPESFSGSTTFASFGGDISGPHNATSPRNCRISCRYSPAILGHYQDQEIGHIEWENRPDDI